MYDFIRKWNSQEHVFKNCTIRAKADKPPEQRKANAKIYLVTKYLKEAAGSEKADDVDGDYRKSVVWYGDSQLVSWNRDTEKLEWNEDVMAMLDISITSGEIEQKMTQS